MTLVWLFLRDHHRVLVGFVSVALAIWTTCHAAMNRRDYRAALWWVGVAWMIPIAGAAFYYFFGINRIQRKAVRLKRRRPSARPAAPRVFHTRSSDPDSVSPAVRRLQKLAKALDQVVHRPLTDGNRITPLVNGDTAYPEMIRAIDAAKHTVGLETYIFNKDRAGQMFIDALARAAQRGVQVRTLIDDVGSGWAWSTVERALARHNVPVAYFLPTRVPYRMAYLNLRNHRKILTVDGRIGFVGGMNIYESHILGLHTRHPVQDIHFKVEGPVVAHLQETFWDDWHFATREALPEQTWFPDIPQVGDVRARGIADGPDSHMGRLRWAMLGAIASAQTSVRIVTPYFVPDPTVVTALGLAALAGVRVDIVLPSVNDLLLVKWASTALLWQVLERGCRVWATPPPFDHSKLMVVDSVWTMFGSANWDSRSLRLNFEFNVESYDPAFASDMDAWVSSKIASAREITLANVDARSFPIRLRDGLARLFAPHL